MAYRVIVTQQKTYEYESLKSSIHTIINGLECGFLQKQRVLLKPNLLAPAREDMAILTHPLVVKAVAEYFIEKGCSVIISDSPAMGSFNKVLKEGGYLDAFKGLPVEFKELKESMRVDIGRPFGEIEIARDVMEADHVINLPKLKTHSQMLLTLGVKNLFGCIVGMEKPRWHLRAGVDRARFAELLYLIAKKIAPSVTLIDGVLAMEGDGPGKSGTPRHLGVMIGGDSAVAVDVTVCRMLKIPPERLFTNSAAFRDGFKGDEIMIDGALIEVKDFRLPSVGPIIFGPERLHGIMRRHLVERPVVTPEDCKQCGQCWSYCPASAIWKTDSSIKFDYERCIRCYCCVEVCPHAALKVREPMAGRVIRRIMNIRG